MSTLQAASPRHLGALVDLLRSAEGPPTFIAGGTDLLVAPRRLPEEGLLIDLSGVEDLANVEARGGALRIGGATTIDALTRHPLILSHLPALAQAAALCGSAQIRNRATIGGNVATASPASDLTPVLKCFRAGFVLLSGQGEWRVEFGALLPEVGGARLGPGELIAEIEIPLEGRLGCSAFVKLGARDDVTIARLNLTIEAEFDPNSFQLGDIRLVVGALAPAPLRLSAVEQTLRGRVLDATTIRSFVAALLASADAAIPGRASHRYKRRALVGLALDLLQKLTGRDFFEEAWS